MDDYWLLWLVAKYVSTMLDVFLWLDGDRDYVIALVQFQRVRQVREVTVGADPQGSRYGSGSFGFWGFGRQAVRRRKENVSASPG